MCVAGSQGTHRELLFQKLRPGQDFNECQQLISCYLSTSSIASSNNGPISHEAAQFHSTSSAKRSIDAVVVKSQDANAVTLDVHVPLVRSHPPRSRQTCTNAAAAALISAVRAQ